MINRLIRKVENFTIRRKLMLVLLLTVGIVLLVATILLSVNEAITARADEKEELSSLGDILAKNASAALLFNDQKASAETLSGLGARTGIISAMIIKSDRSVMAEFQASPSSGKAVEVLKDAGGRFLVTEASFNSLLEESKNRWDWDFDIDVIRPIMLNDSTIGWVIICSDLSKLYRKFTSFIVMIVLVLIIALVMAYILANRFQRVITGPILNLAKTMRSISSTMNYDVKVEKQSSDEIGVVIDSFNDMLEQVRLRDVRLQGQQHELQKSELQFRDISRQFNALLDAMPDSIALISRDRKIIWANHAAACRMSAAPHEEAEPKCYRACFGRSEPCEPCPVERSFQSGEPSVETITTEDGKTWELRAIPVKEQGQAGVVNVIEVSRDNTEQRNIETQLMQAQKMDSIGRFAGGIAHDLNNILSAIIGYSELASTLGPGDANLREYLGTVISSGEKAAALTRQILAFSRKQVMEMRPLDLNVVIEQMGKMIARLIGEDILIVYQLEPRIRNIHADTSQLEQVILNLAVNARDAMPNGGRLKITTADVVLDEASVRDSSTPPGSYIVVTVSDTGTGMTPEIREKIFEPFFTTKERGKGTGLGLATVFGIVKQHHGYIYVDSEPGKGTAFRAYFPATDDARIAEDEPADSAASPGGSETILVVDDDSSLRELVVTMLASLGYRVYGAEGADTALEKSRALPGAIDLLLTDVVMPHKNGREVAEIVLAERAGIKVLFMSGYTDEIIARNGILESGAAFLQKPISRASLAKKVRQVLDGGNTGSLPVTVFPPGRKLSILIADDDKTIYELVKLYVNVVADAVAHAENGQAAVDRFQSGSFDLVIMDMVMPLKDGCSAIEEIRAWERQLGRRPTPIIMMTGNTSREDLLKCSAAGCTGTVAKPLNRDALLQTIDVCLTRSLAPVQVNDPEEKRQERVRVESSFRHLIPGYLRDREEDVRSLEEALKTLDFDRVRIIGHSMKGSGGSYGFDAISAIGKQIEEAAKTGDPGMIKQGTSSLTAYLRSVEVVYG